MKYPAWIVVDSDRLIKEIYVYGTHSVYTEYEARELAAQKEGRYPFMRKIRGYVVVDFKKKRRK